MMIGVKKAIKSGVALREKGFKELNVSVECSDQNLQNEILQ